MQFLKLLQILLHFSVFYNGLVLVLAGKRCLPLISDGTDMLLSFILSSCLYSDNSQALPARKLYMGGGAKTSSAIRLFTYSTTNCISNLFSVFVNVPLSALRLPYSLSAPGSLSTPGDIGRLADGRCGLLIYSGS